jgi:hypothetical protein
MDCSLPSALLDIDVIDVSDSVLSNDLPKAPSIEPKWPTCCKLKQMVVEFTIFSPLYPKTADDGYATVITLRDEDA